MSGLTQEALSIIKILPHGAAIIIACFALIVIIPALLSILEKIVNLFDRKKSTIDKLKEAVNELSSGTVKNALKEELEMQHFRAATGLYLERACREKVIEIHRLANEQYNGFGKASPKLTFKDFEKAHPYLLFDGNEIKIDIQNWQIWQSKISQFLGFILFFFASFVFLLPLLINVLNALSILQGRMTIWDMFPFFFLGFSLVLFSIAILVSTLPVNSAIRIRKALNEINCLNQENSMMTDDN